eukprot:630095_1
MGNNHASKRTNANTASTFTLLSDRSGHHLQIVEFEHISIDLNPPPCGLCLCHRQEQQSPHHHHKLDDTLSTQAKSIPTPSLSTSSVSDDTNIKLHPQPRVHNGVVGIYISLESVQRSVRFWDANVSNLDVYREIGCSIFFSMITTNRDIKKLFIGKINRNKLEEMGPKFLDMMAYVIRSLVRNDIDLYTKLYLLGSTHSTQGISSPMYPLFISAMNETFAYYFPQKYTTDIEKAMNEVFNAVCLIMQHQHAKKIWLASVDECLLSVHGKAALLCYLKQVGCHHMLSFYDLLHQFKSNHNPVERFVIARDIVRFETKKTDITLRIPSNILADMERLNDLWLSRVPFDMDSTYFDDVERGIKALILQKYWNGFKLNNVF